MLTENTKIKRTDLPWQAIEDQTLVLTPENSMAHELNLTASWIWQNIHNEITVQKLLDKFLLEFDIDKTTAKNDIIDLLTKMDGNHLIQIL